MSMTGLFPYQVKERLNINAQAGAEDDFALVSRSRKGDDKAFEVLVRNYQKLVYNVIYQMSRDHDATRDLTQETFLRAYRALPGFQADRSFKPWLLTIARNATLNHLRRLRVMSENSLDELMESNSAMEPVARQSVEEEVEVRLSTSTLNRALDDLPIKQKEVFVLRYQHDLPYDEIAEITGMTLSSVKSLLFRARDNLRRALNEPE